MARKAAERSDPHDCFFGCVDRIDTLSFIIRRATWRARGVSHGLLRTLCNEYAKNSRWGNTRKAMTTFPPARLAATLPRQSQGPLCCWSSRLARCGRAILHNVGTFVVIANAGQPLRIAEAVRGA
ncbi:hypothetical protein WM26_12545 [Burkholderia cepacia]|uniref:hypothetical protein n=1 Tax=Burkholderia cepacia TaxID=292 RepID=UPI00076D6CEB|nr:hypothetical protein [Burkholderia cepacia]KWO12974.1 hypothetical protein WM26_12545 [Burkholderia cepacia]MDW9233921.1 hypothetical protein [Burkholderia cepacia]